MKKTITHYRLDEGLHLFQIVGEIKIRTFGPAWLAEANFDTVSQQRFSGDRRFEGNSWFDMEGEVKRIISSKFTREQKHRLIEWLSSF